MTFVSGCVVSFALEDVPEMAATSGTSNLSAAHTERVVSMAIDRAGYVVKEGWPTTVGVELLFAGEQWGATTSTCINALAKELVVLTSSSSFCALLAEDVKLLRSEDRPPLLLRFLLRSSVRRHVASMCR